MERLRKSGDELDNMRHRFRYVEFVIMSNSLGNCLQLVGILEFRYS